MEFQKHLEFRKQLKLAHLTGDLIAYFLFLTVIAIDIMRLVG